VAGSKKVQMNKTGIRSVGWLIKFRNCEANFVHAITYSLDAR
jgi:hypothetical protein